MDTNYQWMEFVTRERIDARYKDAEAHRLAALARNSSSPIRNRLLNSARQVLDQVNTWLCLLLAAEASKCAAPQEL